MQARAWWLSTVSAVILLASGSLLAAPPKSGASVADIDAYMQSQKSAMESADADTAARIRLDVESGVAKSATGAAPSAEFVIDYVSSATKAFGPLVKGDNKHARLAATILLANLSRANEAPDLALGDALLSSESAIRYWAAKGYYYIIPKYMSFSPTLRESALAKVRNALKNETEPLVRAELYRTLGHAKDTSPDTGALLLHFLRNSVDGMKAKQPSATALNAVAQGFIAAQSYVDAGGPYSNGDRNALLQVVADSVSFPVQHLLAIDAKDPTLVTTDSLNATYMVADSAAKLASALAPAARLDFRLGTPPGNKPSDWLKAFSLNVTKFFGSPTVPGQIQTALPDVKTPAAIGG